MKNARRWFQALLSLGSVALVASCGTPPPVRHVATSGRDAGDCRAAPCRTIGFAVSRASAGDTIVVDSGTYRESVLVTRRLTLVGHDATIDAGGQSSPPQGIRIEGDSAAGTRVTGFTVRNSGLEGIFAVRTSRITIEGDTVLSNDTYGMKDPRCAKRRSACGMGIHLQSVTRSVVRDNLVRGNLGGIYLTDETGPTADDTISHNTVIDNAVECGITLASHWVDTTSATAAPAEVAGVYRNVVVGNTATHNGGAGIGVFAEAPGGAAWGNLVADNTATMNVSAGLELHSHAPAQNVDGNEFRNNIVADNGTDDENSADHGPTGISVASSVLPIRHLVISGNRISRQRYGIVTLHVDSLPDLRGTNTFERTVTEPTSSH